MSVLQDDIVDGVVATTKVDTHKINPATELENNVTASQYSLGYGPGTFGTYVSDFAPLQLKNVTSINGVPNVGWGDEQEIAFYNVSVGNGNYSSTISIPHIVGGVVSITNVAGGNVSIVGIWGAGSWATSNNLNISRQNGAGAGSQSSSLFMVGFDNGGLALSNSELFNGSTWINASSNTSISRVNVGGCGSQNAALCIGGGAGLVRSITEIFNGFSWSTSGNMVSQRKYIGAAGSQNAALNFNGDNGGAPLTTTEVFNGTGWFTGPTMLNGVSNVAGAGSQNAAFRTGGTIVGPLNFSRTEIFNGSSWMFTMNSSISKRDASASGSQNAGICVGGSQGVGDIPAVSLTELFNGYNWITSGNIATARPNLSSGGVSSAAWCAGGIQSTVQSSTELHTQSIYRPLTFENIRTASNIGVMSLNPSTGGIVKLHGYVQNVLPANPFQTAGNYLVLSRFSYTPGNHAATYGKQFPEADDWIIGRLTSVTTTLQVFSHQMQSWDEVGRWG